jgi:phage-related protein
MAVVGSAYIVVNAITTGFQNQVQQAMNGLGPLGNRAGSSLGSGFSSGASRGMTSFQNEAVNTYKQINKLIERSYYLQGAIGVLVPVLGSAAAGIAVIGLEAAAAGPSLMALGGIMSSLLQGMVAFKIAFGGVGKAIGQLTKPSGGGASDNMPQLLRAEADANRALEKAKAGVFRAQEDLNEAYDIAKNRIEDLNFATEDAVIGEKRAAIELEKARETLARVQDLAPNSRARREAELAFAQADLNLRKQKDRVNDLTVEQNKATNNNTWNTQEQILNSKEVLGAEEAKKEAAYQLTRAYDNLAIATKKVDDAMKGVGGAGQDAFAGLNEYQKEFAKFIAGLKPKLDELRLAISETLFPPLQEAIQLLVDRLFPTLKAKLRETGTAIGKSAKDFAALVTTPAGVKDLGIIMDNNNYVIGQFGTILGSITRLIQSLLVAAGPLTRRFTDFVTTITGGWAKDAEGNISGLTDMFNHAGDIAAGFGKAIGNIIGAFMNMGRAVTGKDGAGQTMLDWMIDLTQRFEDFTSKHLASGKLKEYFDTAFGSFQEILSIIGRIIEAILRAGGDGSLEGSIVRIGEGVDAILDRMPALIEGGAAFAEFVGSFLEMTAVFLESGSLQMFFLVLTKAMDALVAFFSVPLVGKIFGVLAAVHGLRLGFSRLGIVAKKVFLYATGGLISFDKALLASKAGLGLFTDGFKYARAGGAGFFAALKGGLTNTKTFQTLFGQNSKMIAYFQTAMGKAKGAIVAMGGALKGLGAAMAANPITIWIVAIVALIAIVVVMYKKFEWFRNFVHAVWGGIKAGLDALWEGIKFVGEQIGGFFAAVWGGIKSAWDAVWPALVIAFKIAVGLIMLPFILMGLAIIGIWKGIKAGWDLVWPLIYNSIQWAWENVIKPVFEIFGVVVGAVWEAMKVAFETAWNIIATSVSFVWNNIIKPVFGLIGTVWSGIWNGIQAVFSTVWRYVSTLVQFYWNNVIKPVFGFIGEIWGKVWGGIKTAFMKAWDFIVGVVNGAKSIFGKIGDAIISTFKSAINFIIRAWNKLEFKIPSAKIFGVTVGGFTLGLPDIPELAEGGVVMPSPGGTLARIAEAGRPERVEPLNEDGLSKRDIAIMKTFAGGAGGGITINVQPSPGMDERELASLISRQLAVQLSRGMA